MVDAKSILTFCAGSHGNLGEIYRRKILFSKVLIGHYRRFRKMASRFILIYIIYTNCELFDSVSARSKHILSIRPFYYYQILFFCILTHFIVFRTHNSCAWNNVKFNVYERVQRFDHSPRIVILLRIFRFLPMRIQLVFRNC